MHWNKVKKTKITELSLFHFATDTNSETFRDTRPQRVWNQDYQCIGHHWEHNFPYIDLLYCNRIMKFVLRITQWRYWIYIFIYDFQVFCCCCAPLQRLPHRKIKTRKIFCLTLWSVENPYYSVFTRTRNLMLMLRKEHKFYSSMNKLRSLRDFRFSHAVLKISLFLDNVV